MRTNLPVSGREYPFPTGQTLVSTTDTKGRILYCNPIFVEVSGFQTEDLLGQPHNLIRHPDMPEEAFRDMWDTIASGKPWSAPVKNRRKDGDHYWVMANATPLMENGVPVGYMSVRTEATREQIQAAEALYATMRQEKQAGKLVHTLKAGRLVKNTVAGKIGEALRLGLATKLFMVLAAVLLVGHFLSKLIPVPAPMGSIIDLVLEGGVLVAAWWYLRHLMISPLDKLIGIGNTIAAGDLTQTVTRTRSDQMGDLEQALGQLTVNLKSIVRDARDQSGEMVHGTIEIAQGNLDLSQRTESQASNLEQTAASMEEITGVVKLSAESAAQASHLSSEVLHTAERSNAAVHDVSSTMKEIQEASRRIADITQVIDSIAFQTNILALNAAVEAARAGEQGRGFAVVASEVRALAQRTSTAAKEIKVLIEESVTSVDAGHTKTLHASKSMDEAVQGVRRVNSLVDEISHAAKEQLTGISQINQAITELDTITQQNAALVEQIAASAQSLEGLAKATTETVRVFRIDSGPQQQVNAVELRKQNRGQGQGGTETRMLQAA